MLAMVAQAPRASRQPASSLTTIASKLAPTEDQDQKRNTTPVGASLLAMSAQAPRAFRKPASSLTTIATVRRFDKPIDTIV